jgi:predicted mannosyl-3-phosphoglycerate phosphatase (HAD superfamily)
MFFIQKCIKIFFLKKIIFDISALKWSKNIKKINLKLKKIKKINLFLKYFKTEKQIRYLSLGFTRRPYIEVYVNEFFFLMYEWSKKKNSYNVRILEEKDVHYVYRAFFQDPIN